MFVSLPPEPEKPCNIGTHWWMEGAGFVLPVEGACPIRPPLHWNPNRRYRVSGRVHRLARPVGI